MRLALAIRVARLIEQQPPLTMLLAAWDPPDAAFQNTLPTFTISGFQQLGSPANTASQFRTDVTQAFDALSWQHNRHSFKVGFDFRWERLDVVQPPSPTGTFAFSTLFTNSKRCQRWGLLFQALREIRSLVSCWARCRPFPSTCKRMCCSHGLTTLEFFVQDDWKATSRLTVNAGLRYTLNFPSTILDNHGAVFNLQTQQLDYLGQNGFPETARQLHKLDLGPRLGSRLSPKRQNCSAVRLRSYLD